jgi:hypothetical protein
MEKSVGTKYLFNQLKFNVMKQLKFLFLTVFILCLVSCEKDEIETLKVHDSVTNNFTYLQLDNWDENERYFFSLEERKPLIAVNRNKSSSGKFQKKYYHPLVIQSYNFIVQQNEKDPFVKEITKKVGFPMWSKVRIFNDQRAGIEFISLPFAFAQENKTTAIFLIKKKGNGDFIIDGISRKEIVENLETCINYNVAKELVISDKWAFDYVDSDIVSKLNECIEGSNMAPPPPPSPCNWITVELCTDFDTQTGYLAGSITYLPPHLDHDGDGVPNDEDQDWYEWSDRYNVTEADLERWWKDYWRDNYEQEIGSYEDFFDNIDQYWDEYYDYIFDGWHDYDDENDDQWGDQGDDQDDDWGDFNYECNYCGFTSNNITITTRNVICEFYVVKDCSDAINGDLSEWWSNTFDEVIPCPNCGDDQYIDDQERFREYYAEKYVETYRITDQSIIDALNEYSLFLLGIVDQDIFNMAMEEKHLDLLNEQLNLNLSIEEKVYILTRFVEVMNYLTANPNHDFKYIINNKTDLNSENTETWDSVDGPYAEHDIEDFDDSQSPWPSYGPVIDKTKAVLFEIEDYDCHVFVKKQLSNAGYKISSYFLDYVGEFSPNNVIHFETIQVYTELDGINVSEIDHALDYLYSALKRGIPVVAGVNTKTGSSNPLTDNTTDHFIVIVGMGSDNNGNYFSFYDSADAEVDKVTHPDNKLYFNNNKFKGKSKADYANGFDYTLTQIRKSKPE